MQLRFYHVALWIAAQICSGVAASGAPLGSGDVLVYQSGAGSFGSGSNAAAFGILDINPGTKSVVQSFISTQLPGAGGGQIFTTTNQPLADLSLDDGGTEVSVAGWRSAGTTGTLGTTQGILRGVATLNSNGQFGLPATYNPAVLDPSPDQPHTAYSPDGVNWYFGDTEGMYYNNGTTKLAGSDGTLSIKGFGSGTYALHTIRSAILPDQENTVGGDAISLVTPSTPGTGSITYTPIIASTLPNPVLHDFYLLSSGNNSVYDILYVTTSDAIKKYALISGTWTAEGSDQLAGATGIAALPAAGGGVTLYVTVAASSLLPSASVLEKITDSAAFNANISASPPVPIYTAPTGDELQGISIAPVPEPASLVLLLLAAAVTGPRLFRAGRQSYGLNSPPILQ